MSFSAVILAGGQSRRMGRDKAFLELEGRPLLARQLEMLRLLAPSEILISGRADADYRSLGCTILTDRFAGSGPVAGIERALEAVATPMVLVLAVDMPGMTAEVLRRLHAGSLGGQGVIPRVRDRLEPLAAFYPKAAWPLAATLLAQGPCAAKHFAERCVQEGFARFQDLEPRDWPCFTSWNCPADITATLSSFPGTCCK